MVSLSYHYLEDEVANHILEALLRMNLLNTILDQKVAEGEARGEARGLRSALRTMLVGRFGTIPLALEERIANADSRTLSDMISRATVAPSLADLERA